MKAADDDCLLRNMFVFIATMDSQFHIEWGLIHF